jgi:hypothetical protein
VTNGNLTAPAYTDISGTILDNGVYNYAGEFPLASQYSANFWVDLAFSPSPGPNIGFNAGAGNGRAMIAIGQSGHTFNSTGAGAGAATPAGPLGGVPGLQGTSSSTARRPPLSFTIPVVSYRPAIRQARALALWGQRSTSLLS